MPGITGIYLKTETNLHIKDLISNMTKIITYEDWYKTDTVVDTRIAFSRVSLGILNPESQPIFNEDKTLWIMMEGEIYDYEILKKGLIDKGHVFKLNNDPEFILHLYEEYSQNFGKKLKDLNGTFLIAIYDAKVHKLTICNDRYGFRPLYWCDRGDYLLFSSEVKSILQDNSFRRIVNLEAVADFFSFGYILGNKTLLENVKLLPAGSLITYFNNKIKIEQYWNYNEIKKLKVENENEIVEELGKLWLQAVDRRMQGDSKIGLSLSGGLDSRAIASAISPKYFPIHAVTFGKIGCDDLKIAKKVADILGMEHHFVEIIGGKWFPNLERGTFFTDGLLNIVHQHTWDAINVMKVHFDIVLDGFAGDLMIGGSYLTKGFLNIEDINEYCNRVFLKMNIGHISIKEEKKFYNSQILNIVHRLCQRSLEKEIRQEIKNSESSDYFFINNRVRRFTLMGSILVQTKLENRKPFFDNDFIEFAYGLPNNLRFDSYIYSKLLLKFFPRTYKSIPWQKTGLPVARNRMVKKIYRYYRGSKSKIDKLLQIAGLPPLFSDSRNFVDYNDWMSNNKELRHYIYDILLSQKALSRNYFNPDYVKQIIENHMSTKKNNAEIIGLLLTFELFNRMFIDGERI